MLKTEAISFLSLLIIFFKLLKAEFLDSLKKLVLKNSEKFSLLFIFSSKFPFLKWLILFSVWSELEFLVIKDTFLFVW